MGIFVIELMPKIMSSVIQKKNYGYFCLVFGQVLATLVIQFNPSNISLIVIKNCFYYFRTVRK